MDFEEYLKASKSEIDREIERFFDDWLKEVGEIDKGLYKIVKVFAQSCQGGKRLRGTLVKLGYELGMPTAEDGSQQTEDILRVAAAFEIFQTAILAHDDIIDDSDLRRGRPTIYKQLGMAQTISLGDIGFFLSSKLIAETDFEPDKKNSALATFANMEIKTGLGEVLDVAGGDPLTISRLKTAYYTLVAPLSVGAVLAGASQNQLDQLAKFGTNLGIAFQLQDDILGVFGSEEQLGKSVTSDIEEGKNTLLYAKAKKKANSSQLEVLRQYYGQKNIGKIGLEEIRKVFISTGALAATQKEALKYVDLAKKEVSNITVDFQSKDTNLSKILVQMAEYLIRRTK